jgi:hypothetical protein
LDALERLLGQTTAALQSPFLKIDSNRASLEEFRISAERSLALLDSTVQHLDEQLNNAMAEPPPVIALPNSMNSSELKQPSLLLN